MYSTPCSLRLFASKSAPLISAMNNLLSLRTVVRPGLPKIRSAADYAFIAGRVQYGSRRILAKI
jgi:hypothetical protein